MRLYRFMGADNAFRSIRERRLRVGRIDELNDDFEFIGLAMELKEERIALRNMRKGLSDGNRIVCMSSAWGSPLMWGHYADSHKGVALGFDVKDDEYYKVEYIRKRPTLADMGLTALADITPDDIKRLLRQKSAGWRYEKEYRAYVGLKDGVRINGQVQYFLPFTAKHLTLREVIVGSRFQTARKEVEEAVGDPSVDIFMARGDFEKFKVVRQNQDSIWR